MRIFITLLLGVLLGGCNAAALQHGLDSFNRGYYGNNNPYSSPAAKQTQTCFGDGEQSSGFAKICYYRCLGDRVAVNKRSTDICPLSIQR